MTSGNTGPQRSRYARMDCPVTGCRHGKGGERLNGTVPGVKRHVLRKHGQLLYDEVKWPPLYVTVLSPGGDALRDSLTLPPKPYAEMNIHELRAAAKKRGIPQRDKNKAEFIAALEGDSDEER